MIGCVALGENPGAENPCARSASKFDEGLFGSFTSMRTSEGCVAFGLRDVGVLVNPHVARAKDDSDKRARHVLPEFRHCLPFRSVRRRSAWSWVWTRNGLNMTNVSDRWVVKRPT